MTFNSIDGSGGSNSKRAAMRRLFNKGARGINNLQKPVTKEVNNFNNTIAPRSSSSSRSSSRSSYSAPPPPAPSPSSSAPAPANSWVPPVSSTGQISSFGSSGGGGGGGGGGRSAPPAPPALNQFLAGDTAFQSTGDAIAKARADYIARMNQEKGQYNTEYGTNLDNLNQSRETALSDLENDFAGRGLINSGLYGNATSELMSDYDARQAALEQGKSNFLADLQSAFQDFRGEQRLTKTKAKQDAINRRAQKYGL